MDRLSQMTYFTLIFDPYVNGIENKLSSYYESYENEYLMRWYYDKLQFSYCQLEYDFFFSMSSSR